MSFQTLAPSTALNDYNAVAVKWEPRSGVSLFISFS